MKASVPRCPKCDGSVLSAACLLCSRTFTLGPDGALIEDETRPAVKVRREWQGPNTERMPVPPRPLRAGRRIVPISTMIARAAKWGTWK